MIYSLLLAKGGLFDPIAKPLAAVLAFFYSLVPNYGLAIVLLTIAMMIVLTPLTIKQTRSMLVMQKLQPEMKKLQEIHKNDRQALNEAVMALYKEHNASPLGGCLPMLLPFPLFIALLRVLEGLSHTVHQGAVTIAEPKYLTAHTRMYKDIVAAHGQLDAFGMNLAKSARSVGGGFVHSLPYFVLLLLMVGTQFYQQYQLTSKNPAAKSQPGQAAMMKFIPLFFGLISLNFPAGVVLYWTVSNIIRVGQQWALYRYDPKVKALVAKDVKEIEAKTREIEATHKDKPAGGRARFRDLLSNAAEAAADRRSPGGKGAAKPGAKPLGDKSGAPGKGGRTPPGKATTGTSGAASKSLRPATPAGAKGSGNQKGNQRPGAPKGITSKTGPNKAGGAGGAGGAAKAGGAKPGGAAAGGAKAGGGVPTKPGVKPAGAGSGGGGGAKQGGGRPSGGGGGAAKQTGGNQKATPAKATSSPEGADAVPTTPVATPTPVAPQPVAAPTPAAAPPTPVASAAPEAAPPIPAVAAGATSAPVVPAAPTAASTAATTAAEPTGMTAAEPTGTTPAEPAGTTAATAATTPAEPAKGTNGAAKAAVASGNGAGNSSDDGGTASDDATATAANSGNGAPAKGRTGGGSARNVNPRRRRKGR
jgi:YidC/Oxa1 family membrane protein insertase